MALITLKGSPLSGENTLDKLIRYCDRHALFQIGDEKMKVGVFLFRARPHSTGCSVDIWIDIPDHKVRLIYKTTFWYSSDYTFNTTSIERGDWDDALESAKNEMALSIKNHKEKTEFDKKIRAEREAKSEDNEKAEFELAFNKQHRGKY